jgi:FixJ family two-component response regulator
MFEIDNPTLRRRKLVDYSGVEKHMLLEADGAPLVRGVSVVDDTDSTAKDGKTAAVHFLQFPFDNSSLLERLKNAQRVTFRVTHPQYMHSADLPPAAIAAIKHDLAL